MPTPFYHLLLAQDLLNSPAVEAAVKTRLEQHWGAFLLGNTAPDVQVITHQDRTVTHFFDLPIPPGAPLPWRRMQAEYPALAAALPAEQAVFVAGYICHLAADWRWVLEIFAPVFGPACRWANFGTRLFLHNTLRAYLDRDVVPALAPQTFAALQGSRPSAWLPFVADASLETWRDYLYPQLAPGAVTSTVEVFAARQGIDPQVYYRLIDSGERMQSEVFSRLSRASLLAYRRELLAESAGLVNQCLAASG